MENPGPLILDPKYLANPFRFLSRLRPKLLLRTFYLKHPMALIGIYLIPAMFIITQ